MRVSSVLALSAAAALMLGACGGEGSSSESNGANVDTGQLGNTGGGTDATATGPVSIDGAQKGGVVTVLTNTGLTTTIDPAEAYYLDTMSVDGQLLTRSLTQDWMSDRRRSHNRQVPNLGSTCSRRRPR